MRIILVSKRYGSTRCINLGAWARVVVPVILLGVPAGFAFLGYKFFNHDDSDLLTQNSREAWVKALNQQHTRIGELQKESDKRLAALTLRVAELQARLVRLDALGERLTTMAHLDSGEFNFSQPPAVGGPEIALDPSEEQGPSIDDMIKDMSQQIEDRQQQLDTLEALLANRKLQNDVFLAGRPVHKGFISSRYGRRTDPFTGAADFHGGVDFAAKKGTEVVSVASGVVTWAGARSTYGNMIEINHGNGFTTRYGHCEEVEVKVGDIVKKGQVIGLVGSTGRSTGPHVHFEVRKDGHSVDPITYIQRANR